MKILTLAGLALCLGIGAPGGGSDLEMQPVSADEVTTLTRLDSRLFSIAHWARIDADGGSRFLSIYLEELGIKADSPGAAELVALAQEVEAAHPRAVSPAVLERYEGDEAGFQEWQMRRRTRRAEALGEGLGEWLSRREGEGYALDPLLNRLLNSPGSGPAVFMVGDDAEAGLKAETDLQMAFEQALERTLGRVPARIASPKGSEG